MTGRGVARGLLRLRRRRAVAAPGMQHDYFHPDGRVTACHVRYMTRAEVVECYRLLLLGDVPPAMRMAFGARRLPFTVEDARRELAGKALACWCPLPATGEPDHCHAFLLLTVANGWEVPEYAAAP